MTRLTVWKLVIGIVVGAIFASLQGDPPVSALAALAIERPAPRPECS
jgi:hypothetical protein